MQELSGNARLVGVRQAPGHTAGRRSVLTHPKRSLLPGAGCSGLKSAVTVAGPGLFMDLGHGHLYPDGSQVPGKNQGLGKGS